MQACWRGKGSAPICPLLWTMLVSMCCFILHDDELSAILWLWPIDGGRDQSPRYESHVLRACLQFLQVKTSAVNKSSGHTFYVMTSGGAPPDREKVQALCSRIGGKLVEVGEEERSMSPPNAHRFSFSFLQRKWQKGWGGTQVVGSPESSFGSL